MISTAIKPVCLTFTQTIWSTCSAELSESWGGKTAHYDTEKVDQNKSFWFEFEKSKFIFVFIYMYCMNNWFHGMQEGGGNQRDVFNVG